MERLVSPELSGNIFTKAWRSFVHGDIWVKLSAVIFGAGYFGRKQYVKAVLMTLLEAVFLYALIALGVPYLQKFTTLGTVQLEMVFNINTMKNEVNNYDNSFLILLFGVVTICGWLVFIALWLGNLSATYKLMRRAQMGKHINNFIEDATTLINEKFHITLLSLPGFCIVCFTVIPLIVTIAVAFTNYDQAHMPPNALFTWVGLTNFKNLFGDSITLTFGYSFRKVLTWTLIWSFFATFTTYFGGTFLAMLINSKTTKWPKMWRTLFIVTIAVPQFVTLLLVRNFFADSGIVNTILANIGLTGFLQKIGLVSSSNMIPFLTSPGWAKFTIIMINIWIGVPYQMLIATGVLMNIPQDILESAKIDGANGFRRFRSITLPYLFSVTGPALVTDFVKNVNNFNVIYLLTQDVFVTKDQALASSNAKEIDLLVTWLFRLTQEYYNYKMASVIGIMVFIVCAVFTLICFNIVLRGDKEKAFG